MDCSWDEGNNGCDGGEDFRAYEWIIKNGLATDDSYGPYLSQVCKETLYRYLVACFADDDFLGTLFISV